MAKMTFGILRDPRLKAEGLVRAFKFRLRYIDINILTIYKIHKEI